MNDGDAEQGSVPHGLRPLVLPAVAGAALVALAAVWPGSAAAPRWVQVTGEPGWRARDSAGELVFGGKMWLLGGWHDSYSPAPRDVWSSADGRTWALVNPEAPWRHSDLAMTVVFRDAMWLMGGWTEGRLPGHAAGNEVWRSADGLRWEKVAAAAGWSPRLAAGAVVFKDKLWILGGSEDYYFGNERSLRNDVWSSEDGANWILETSSAPWAPRAFHQALVFDGRLWVLGGGNYLPGHFALNDVWSSEDGRRWTRATDIAPWPPRLWFSAVVWRGRMWVLGGWSKNTGNLGDVWHSADGVRWERLETGTCWSPRHEHSAFVFQDAVWVAGGMSNQGLTREVWRLETAGD